MFVSLKSYCTCIPPSFESLSCFQTNFTNSLAFLLALTANFKRVHLPVNISMSCVLELSQGDSAGLFSGYKDTVRVELKIAYNKDNKRGAKRRLLSEYRTAVRVQDGC